MKRGPLRRETFRAACRSWLVLALGAGVAGASAPPATLPSQGGPSAVPALADTARLVFASADTLPGPQGFHVLADSVAFGGLLPVAWDLPAGDGRAIEALPAVAGDEIILELQPTRRWWEFARRRPAPANGARSAALPATSGRRVFVNYRIYRTAPFRFEWAGRSSGVVTVRGRVADPSRLASIRDPRPVTWLTPLLVVLLALPLLAAAMIWWWRRRRARRSGPSDWPLPEPAWIATSLTLSRLLLEDRHLERGDPRRFLDGLAAVARRHAAAHYGILAAEMTGSELVDACRARGYDPALPEALARLIDAADLHRYDPQAPVPEWCRREAVTLLECLAQTRVLPRQTPIEPGRLLAASRAWADVSAALAGSGADARPKEGVR